MNCLGGQNLARCRRTRGNCCGRCDRGGSSFLGADPHGVTKKSPWRSQRTWSSDQATRGLPFRIGGNICAEVISSQSVRVGKDRLPIPLRLNANTCIRRVNAKRAVYVDYSREPEVGEHSRKSQGTTCLQRATLYEIVTEGKVLVK